MNDILQEKEKELIPNRTYLEMVFSAPTVSKRGKNEKEIFENCGNGQFSHTVGTIGVKLGYNKPKVRYYDMEQWDDMVLRKISQGYTIIKKEKKEAKIIEKVQNGEFKPLEDKEVQEFIDWLRQGAKDAFDESYTISVDDISDEMIALANSIIDDLMRNYKTMPVATFNLKLRQLYQAVPRHIKRYSDELINAASTEKDREEKLVKEQDLLTFMIQQVRSNNIINNTDTRSTVLEAFGFDEWRKVTIEEENYIKRLMGNNSSQYVRAWRVVNHKTEANFNEYCKKYGNNVEENINHLFHGSDTKNWWSIATNGLYLDPAKIAGTGASVCGKAFGYGSYFAPKAQKSIGYTSVRGSYWKKGNENKAYLAIFKVATGDKVNGIYDIYGENLGVPQHWSDLQRIKPGADCTWAYAGKGYVINDEVIVYKEEQSTIEYLIEFDK